MNATIVLVDSHHGVNCAESLCARYPLFTQDGGFRPLTLSELLSPDNCEWFDSMDLSVRNDDGTYWRVEFHEGDLIAVNPDAQWCDECEQYEVGPCPELIEEKVEAIIAAQTEYAESHQDAGNSYAHIPREGSWSYNNCDDRLRDFITQNEIKTRLLDIDTLADLVLANFTMVSRHMYHRPQDHIFAIASYAVGEVEIPIEPRHLDLEGVTVADMLEACSDLRENGDSVLAYGLSDMFWCAEIGADDLQELINEVTK